MNNMKIVRDGFTLLQGADEREIYIIGGKMIKSEMKKVK
jgi:hypothetical protein